ncbi:MAG: tetratricopeptide repeat protein [Myxococcota bacterium]|nr:tetratricopeptide repeat protein [Myxococcota bacterium]
MSAPEIQELVSQADRARRRGEMSEAVRLYEQVLAQDPGDEAVQRKLANVRENLQPSELAALQLARATAASTEPSAPQLRPMTPEQEGERLFALGDFAGAAAAYRRALRDKPDSELIRERLVELFQLAQAAPRNSTTDQALPRDPTQKLQALLDRISARKKVNVG